MLDFRVTLQRLTKGQPMALAAPRRMFIEGEHVAQDRERGAPTDRETRSQAASTYTP